MFPIRDDAPRSTTPFINYFLIVLNIAIFLFEWSLQLSGGPRARADFEMQFAFIPEHVGAWMQGYLPASVAFVPFLSSMFLHASLPHVLLNMWGLAIFGDNVEDRLGHFRYLAFYIVCGLGAGLTHLIFNFNSTVPTVGASGAIAGVMGAYLVLYPRARVLTWWGFFRLLAACLACAGLLDHHQPLEWRCLCIGGDQRACGWCRFLGARRGICNRSIADPAMPTRKNVYAFEDY